MKNKHIKTLTRSFFFCGIIIAIVLCLLQNSSFNSGNKLHHGSTVDRIDSNEIVHGSASEDELMHNNIEQNVVIEPAEDDEDREFYALVAPIEVSINDIAYLIQLPTAKKTDIVMVANAFCRKNYEELQLTASGVEDGCVKVITNLIVQEVNRRGVKVIEVNVKPNIPDAPDAKSESNENDSMVEVQVPVSGGRMFTITFNPLATTLNKVAEAFCRDKAAEFSLNEHDVVEVCSPTVRDYVRVQLQSAGVEFHEILTENPKIPENNREVQYHDVEMVGADGVKRVVTKRRPTGFIRANIYVGNTLMHYMYDIDSDRRATATKFCVDHESVLNSLFVQYELFKESNLVLDKCAEYIDSISTDALDKLIQNLVDISSF